MLENPNYPYRLKPFAHQVEGTFKLVNNSFFALFDEMGSGKSRQVIDAAMLLFHEGIINRVLVICPAAVRSVWYNPEFGELQKHLWEGTKCRITEYHDRLRFWHWPESFDDAKTHHLRFTITNYDFIISPERLTKLQKICGPKTFLVLDESSAIKNWKAKRTTACWELRKHCGRVVLLNGTPIANNPGDLYTQAAIMHPNILACKSWFHFRARYGVLGGWQGKQVIGWKFIEDLQRRLGPHVLRRLKKQCLDLPEKLPSVVLEVPLSEKTWKIYKQMRDDMVSWLSQQSVSMASQAVVKALRLSQITSGFAGGVEDADILDSPQMLEDVKRERKPPEEIGREKLDFLLDLHKDWLSDDKELKLLVWARFRAEIERTVVEIEEIQKPKIVTGRIWGGQKQFERDAALRLLDPNLTPKAPVVVVGSPSSGSMGLNLTAAHTVVYLSNDYSLKTRLQSEDRTHRPGQVSDVAYFDLVATGPKGQKTIDHMVIKALKNKEALADLTTGAWVHALTGEFGDD